MPPVEQHKRLSAGLFVVICLTPIAGSAHPSNSAFQNQTNQRQIRQSESDVARYSAQLKSSDVEERRDAAMRLSVLDGEAAASALAAALTDPSPLVRAVVAAGLGERQDPSSAPLLAARLTSDKDAFVRKAAAYALGGFSGAERTAALIGAIKDRDPEVRGAAAVSLGDHADPAAISPLTAALSDKNAFVRAQAARALGVNGRAAARTVPALIGLLTSDRDAEVKRQAAAALGQIGDRSALSALERASHDADTYLGQAARDSIRMIEGGKP